MVKKRQRNRIVQGERANKQERHSIIEDEEKFQLFVKKNKDKTQTRMAELWRHNITQQNISYTCQKLGITRKKTYGYQERNETEREAFREKVSKIDKKRRVYVDKAGFDNREDYGYGYSPRGERCYALKCGKKRERASWIGALNDGKILIPLTFKGCCHRDLKE